MGARMESGKNLKVLEGEGKLRDRKPYLWTAGKSSLWRRRPLLHFVVSHTSVKQEAPV